MTPDTLAPIVAAVNPTAENLGSSMSYITWLLGHRDVAPKLISNFKKLNDVWDNHQNLDWRQEAIPVTDIWCDNAKLVAACMPDFPELKLAAYVAFSDMPTMLPPEDMTKLTAQAESLGLSFQDLITIMPYIMQLVQMIREWFRQQPSPTPGPQPTPTPSPGPVNPSPSGF